jgi:hypothetical protein
MPSSAPVEVAASISPSLTAMAVPPLAHRLKTQEIAQRQERAGRWPAYGRCQTQRSAF